MKTYPLSMTRNYVAKWGVTEAVRELIQNSLDSERPFVYEFAQDEEIGTVLSLHSAGVTLGPEMLLLGKTGKADDPMAIGQFGEGFKLALLVLTREGRDVAIRNGGVTWCPFFQRSELFGGEEQLVVHETAGDPKNEDLVFEIYSLTDDEVSQIVASCLLMQHEIGLTVDTPDGDILPDRPGALYVGNLYVCKTSMKHGYNIRPDRLKLDRDRQTVDSWTLGNVVLRMWYATKNWDLMAQMIDDEVPDVANARWDVLPTELQKACYDRFRKEHPNARVAASSSEMAKFEKIGARAVRVNSGMHHAISSYPAYRTSMPDVVERTPQEVLQAFRDKYGTILDVGDEASAEFGRIVEEAKNWSIE